MDREIRREAMRTADSSAGQAICGHIRESREPQARPGFLVASIAVQRRDAHSQIYSIDGRMLKECLPADSPGQSRRARPSRSRAVPTGCQRNLPAAVQAVPDGQIGEGGINTLGLDRPQWEHSGPVGSVSHVALHNVASAGLKGDLDEASSTTYRKERPPASESAYHP